MLDYVYRDLCIGGRGTTVKKLLTNRIGAAMGGGGGEM
jgi:hypothetical protein